METSAANNSRVCAKCGKPEVENAKFCPYCGAVPQPPSPTPEITAKVEESAPNPITPPIIKVSPQADLRLRASENIWSHTEPEGDIIPGAQRPLLVLDEQSVHLSHTDNVLEPSILLERIGKIIDAYSVPVEVKLSSTRWLSDSSEVRPRIVASLKDHAYSDFKMIFGVDYMGKWASVKMYLAFEPPIIPPPPPPPKEPKMPDPVTAVWPGGSLFCFVLAALIMLTGIGAATQSNMSGFFLAIFVAVAFAIGGVSIRGNSLLEKNQKRDREVSNLKKQYEADLAKYNAKVDSDRENVEEDSMAKSFFRTYKIDDMRLFSSAMKVVFQVVIDDIVKTEGAKIEKIEGGKGGFLSEDGVTSIAQAPRQADAAEDFAL